MRQPENAHRVFCAEGSGPDPYGNLIDYTYDASVEDNPFRFSTKFWNAEVGLYDYGYRHYAPPLGRWVNRDPMGERGAVNLHRFTENQPVNFVDSFGLSATGADDYLSSLVSGEEIPACCYPDQIKEIIHGDAAIRDALLGLRERKRRQTGQSCLGKIRCGACREHILDDGAVCPSCSKTIESQYHLSDDGSSAGVISVCSEPTAEKLRHELQHAYQCGEGESCAGKDGPSESECASELNREIEARTCGQKGTGKVCDPEVVRRFNNPTACWVEVAYDVIGGDYNARKHTICPKCIGYCDGGSPAACVSRWASSLPDPRKVNCF